MNSFIRTLRLIARQVRPYALPSVTLVSRHHDPFTVLISCILSLRTKDKTTIEASQRLFQVADNPQDMLQLSPRQIQRLIYPVGFYRIKAKVISGICRRLMAQFGGNVPSDRQQLLQFKGVGRKTANLVLGLGYGIPAICVDTHVHRIPNRLGWVRTTTPEQTETALEKLIPKRSWIRLNTYLVAFGQHICLPVSPCCSRCQVYRFCQRRGVRQHR